MALITFSNGLRRESSRKENRVTGSIRAIGKISRSAIVRQVCVMLSRVSSRAISLYFSLDFANGNARNSRYRQVLTSSPSYSGTSYE